MTVCRLQLVLAMRLRWRQGDAVIFLLTNIKKICAYTHAFWAGRLNESFRLVVWSQSRCFQSRRRSRILSRQRNQLIFVNRYSIRESILSKSSFSIFSCFVHTFECEIRHFPVISIPVAYAIYRREGTFAYFSIQFNLKRTNKIHFYTHRFRE